MKKLWKPGLEWWSFCAQTSLTWESLPSTTTLCRRLRVMLLKWWAQNLIIIIVIMMIIIIIKIIILVVKVPMMIMTICSGASNSVTWRVRLSDQKDCSPCLSTGHHRNHFTFLFCLPHQSPLWSKLLLNHCYIANDRIIDVFQIDALEKLYLHNNKISEVKNMKWNTNVGSITIWEYEGGNMKKKS